MKHTTTLVQRGSLMLIVCLLIATPRLAAQSNYSQKSATRQITAGLYGVIGLSHAFTGQEGDGVFREDEITVPTLAWRAGAVAGYPITPVIRATLGLGLDARGFHSEIPSSLGRTAVTSNIRYFSITPGMQFSAFTLALNIGLPMGGSYTSGDATVDFDDDDTEQLATMIEPRIGAVIPLVDEQAGWLGLLIEAGYPLTSVNKPQEVGNTTVDDPHQLMSLQLGLTWQFALGGGSK